MNAKRRKDVISANQRWVETPDGYIWLPYLQPIRNAPNLPIQSLPDTSLGGGMWVEVSEKYGSDGDILWGTAEAFRPLTSEEIALISFNVEGKRMVVDIRYQTLSCYEGNTKVYFTHISSGALYNYLGEKVDAWATPIGRFPIWRKLVPLHMSGGTTGGGWVNARPEDAKWIFRWTQPSVPYDPGDTTVAWPGGTIVEVKET